ATEIQVARPARPGDLMRVPFGYGLTATEVVRVLTGKQFPPGPLSPRRDRVLRPSAPGVTGETANAIGEWFRKRFGSYAREEEIVRARAWARKLGTSPEARDGGARPWSYRPRAQRRKKSRHEKLRAR